jgi:hypothetical protein
MITNATKLNFQWKVIASIKNPAALLDNSLYFSLATNTGLNSQFSISHNLAYTPKLLLPTITYFQLLKNILADQRIRLDEPKFPFTLSTDYFEKGTFNIRIRFFFPDVICLTVSLNQQTQLIKHPSPEDLIDYQSFKKLRSIAALVQATIGLANSLNHKDLPITNQFLIKPAIHLCDLTTPGDFDDYRKKHLRNAAADRRE